MALPKLGEKKNCFGNCGNAIAENVKNKKKNLFWQLWQWHCRKCKKKYIYIYIYIFFDNCGNAIAEKGKKKKFVLAIVAIPLPKM